jgi:transcriptional regulator with XRE-family HTH domain
VASSNAITFGHRLRELREAAGMTQIQLAERSGMHRQGIAKLELGEREPTWATVQALAAALGVDCTAFQDQGERPSGQKAAPNKGKGRK